MVTPCAVAVIRARTYTEHNSTVRVAFNRIIDYGVKYKSDFPIYGVLSMLADEPKSNGRKSDGTFAPGNALGGRTPGSRHKVTLAIEALLEGQHEALTQKAIDKALEGDVVALRLCLDRLAPPRKDAPVSFDLPPIKSAADTVAASSALLDAVAAGEVTPDEAGRVMALLTAHKSLVEAGDLEARISALEAKK
jgi:hypothetical protein